MTTTAASQVDALAERFWAGILDQNPLWATMLGDESSADRWHDPGPAGRELEQALVDSVLSEADDIDPTGLGTEERITLGMVRVVATVRRRADEHRVWHFDAADQIAGPQALPGDLARLQRVDGAERVERLVARLDAYPAFVDASVANLREGVRAGRTASARVVERTIDQVRRMVATPVDRSPLLLAHPELPDADREAIGAAVERSVQPALAAFLAALEAYQPHARVGDGLVSLPDGDALYRYLVLASTTLDEDPAAIHEHGLERLDAIRAEAAATARELGQRDVASLRAALAADASNVAAAPDDLVRMAAAQVERTTAVAPRWFGRLPEARIEVRAVEPHQEQEAPPAFYLQPAPDGSRPGVYYINTFGLPSRPLHRLAATTYHEAVPGHHFQIALELEHEGLPAFRRFGSRLAGAAYTEGWGLYSERLADEMGLYEGARERFGMLEAQAWRAARLVVDTGLHAFGWDRQRSIDVLREAAGLSELEAATETDRYIAWPGQALAYMTGQREIEALRRELEARDGLRFDLRAFHDEILGHGALPLATLRAELPRWVKPRG